MAADTMTETIKIHSVHFNKNMVYVVLVVVDISRISALLALDKYNTPPLSLFTVKKPIGVDDIVCKIVLVARGLLEDVKVAHCP